MVVATTTKTKLKSSFSAFATHRDGEDIWSAELLANDFVTILHRFLREDSAKHTYLAEAAVLPKRLKLSKPYLPSSELAFVLIINVLFNRNASGSFFSRRS